MSSVLTLAVGVALTPGRSNSTEDAGTQFGV